jgi:hypothetical protein
MSLLNDIQFDVNRIVLGLFIPGVFATAPFMLVFFEFFPDAQLYLYNTEFLLTLFVLCVSITTGFVIEDIASHIELKVYDEINKCKYPKHMEEWDKYLSLKIPRDTELIAQRYLRTILVRMKFELSMAISLIIAFIGLCILNDLTSFTENIINFNYYLFTYIFIIVFFFYESFQGSRLLIKKRKLILKNSK